MSGSKLGIEIDVVQTLLLMSNGLFWIVSGFVGPLSSWTSLSVAGLIKQFNAPAVAPRPTSSALSNKALYPTFYRTSPSSAALVRVSI